MPDSAFEQAIALKPHYAQPYHNLANLLRLQENLTEALKYASEAVRLDPNSYQAQNNLG
uniref:Tetratricopeptide repeat protein n=1 Tax=Desertifilum tharense IPPAS B-1220 TaxID=1781255 RepID=A0ACD5H2B6_9CYAN